MGSTYYDDVMSVLINNLEQLPKFKKVLSDEGKKSLTIIRYKKSEATYHSCPILCTDFEENEEITSLPCNHCFNSNAIEKWLTEEKSECPICRLELDYNKMENAREYNAEEIEVANSIAAINTQAINTQVINTQANDPQANDPQANDPQAINAAYTLIDSLNRVSNITNYINNVSDINNISNINDYRRLWSINQRVLRARIMSEDDDIQEAIIASLSDFSFSG
jgi:hypothetical protein